MLLIVGLGNPGKRYAATPHNAGYVACDRFADRNHLGPEVAKFQGRFRRGRIGQQDVGVLKPETYMNLSGDAVAEALRYLPVEIEDLLVVFDEMDLPSGKLRLRKAGGHGGHNGLRSVIDRIGSRDFKRMRIGVGRPPSGRDPTGHLLSRVRPEERERLSDTIDLAVEALETVVASGFEAAMNHFNGLPPLGEEGDDKA